MRQVAIVRHSAPDVLKLRAAPGFTAGRGEIRIAVRAADVNFADVLARLGLYPDAHKPPVVVGYEVSGIVDAIGPEVIDHHKGDHVLALTRFGGYADQGVVPASFAFAIQDAMADTHAAAIPVNYVTASSRCIANRNRGVFGLNLGHLWDERHQLTEAMTLLLREVGAGRLQPVVAQTFPLKRAADAHRFLQSRSNIGKVVLTT